MRKKILLDLDGVLADFVQGASVVHNKDPKLVSSYGIDIHWGLIPSEFWSPLGYEFWANLPLTAEAHEVVDMCSNAVGKENVGIITSPCLTEGCTEGKRTWVKEHFPDFLKNLLVGSAKYFCASPNTLLIDDWDTNCEKFREHGGAAFLFPQPWNTARECCGNKILCLRDALPIFIEGIQ